MIKLLVVDDSGFMRMAIRKMVEGDPEIKVVGEARNGAIALAMIEDLKPDIITMDVEMPEMDGLTAAKEIMARFPRPIIMISSLTESGAETTIKALAAGVVDFISKKSSFVQLDIVQIGQELLEKIHLWYDRRLTVSVVKRGGQCSSSSPTVLEQPRRVTPGGPIGMVVIGLSTGGPAMLPGVLKEMGRLSCPVVIAQHMPQMFTRSFAGHLRSDTGLNVVEGEHAMALGPGLVVIAPGGTDSMLREPFPGKFSLALKLREEMPIHPSVDALFLSAAAVTVNVVAVILTGMGDDGTAGALALRKKNAPVLVQEFASCVVDGMPSAAVKAGAATEILPPAQIGQRLKRWAG